MNIYFLSGLGADSRVFKYLVLPSSFRLIYIDWLPLKKGETLRSYAKKMADKIDAAQPFALIGLSFGGILATEILKFVKPVKTILISSLANSSERPFYFPIAGALRLNKLIPSKHVNKPNFLSYWLFGVTTNSDKKLLGEILTDSDTVFSKWAVNEILHWKSAESDSKIIRIHGDKDRLLPIKNFTPQYVVKGGGHFMIVNRAEEISEIISKELSSQHLEQLANVLIC